MSYAKLSATVRYHSRPHLILHNVCAYQHLPCTNFLASLSLSTENCRITATYLKLSAQNFASLRLGLPTSDQAHTLSEINFLSILKSGV